MQQQQQQQLLRQTRSSSSHSHTTRRASRNALAHRRQARCSLCSLFLSTPDAFSSLFFFVVVVSSLQTEPPSGRRCLTGGLCLFVALYSVYVPLVSCYFRLIFRSHTMFLPPVGRPASHTHTMCDGSRHFPVPGSLSASRRVANPAKVLVRKKKKR